MCWHFKMWCQDPLIITITYDWQHNPAFTSCLVHGRDADCVAQCLQPAAVESYSLTWASPIAAITDRDLLVPLPGNAKAKSQGSILDWDQAKSCVFFFHVWQKVLMGKETQAYYEAVFAGFWHWRAQCMILDMCCAGQSADRPVDTPHIQHLGSLEWTHLNTALWLWSLSSPLMKQENNPKDSAPGGKGVERLCAHHRHIIITGKIKAEPRQHHTLGPHLPSQLRKLHFEKSMQNWSATKSYTEEVRARPNLEHHRLLKII